MILFEYARRRRIWASALLALAAVVAAAPQNLGGTAVSEFAARVESRLGLGTARVNREITGFIVLGGNESRMREALALARLYPRARFILSGPGENEVRMLASASELDGRLVIDRRARNTYENALYSRAIAGTDASWVVVTSFWHMPRAIAAFRAVGFAVKPWTVHDTPVAANQAFANVTHEFLGLVYYLLSGRAAFVS